jgi:hypothetical protein
MRESGYYWIKTKHTNKQGEFEWEVAYFDQDENGWFSIWDGGAYTDRELTEIDENKLTR